MRLTLLQHGPDLIASEEEKFIFVIGITFGSFWLEMIGNWLHEHVIDSK